MAIVKNPKRLQSASVERKAEEFISRVGHEQDETGENRKPTIVRFKPELMRRIDRAAERLGLSRSAFIASAAAEKLERMES
jgi:hypothetical protein